MKIKLTSNHVINNSIILVNQTHPIKHDFNPNQLVPFHPDYPLILLEKDAAFMLAILFQKLDCFKKIVPVSGYRNWQEQEQIYTDSLRDNGEDFTSKFVALPGCSEHQTGLAIDLSENKPDIDFICPSFPRTGICQEFRKYASQYGFIERYQEGCEDITGIAPEPWHFRYVGKPHAMFMERNHLTLEEYTELLMRIEL